MIGTLPNVRTRSHWNNPKRGCAETGKEEKQRKGRLEVTILSLLNTPTRWSCGTQRRIGTRRLVDGSEPAGGLSRETDADRRGSARIRRKSWTLSRVSMERVNGAGKNEKLRERFSLAGTQVRTVRWNPAFSFAAVHRREFVPAIFGERLYGCAR